MKFPQSLSREASVERLRAAGCRITAQRIAIIDFLSRTSEHPSARQVYASVSAEYPGISLATVYNTLRTLVEVGALGELEFDGVENRYDTTVVPHLNLVCTCCGSVFDVEAQLSVNPEDLEQTMGFVTSGVRLEYRGRCARCAGNEEGRSTTE